MKLLLSDGKEIHVDHVSESIDIDGRHILTLFIIDTTVELPTPATFTEDNIHPLVVVDDNDTILYMYDDMTYLYSGPAEIFVGNNERVCYRMTFARENE